MSHSSSSTDQEPLANDSGEARPLADSVVVSPLAAVLTPIRILGFWTAVALPFLYLPLLVVGIESASRATAFLGLLVLDVLALLIGRSHKLD